MDRRTFTGTLAAVTAGLAAMPRLDEREPGTLPARRLGATDMLVPILSLGGFHMGQAGSASQARELVAAALDEGIRFFDTAESYQSGTSERWLGAALKDRRADVLLMSKTFAFPERTADSARRHLEGTLSRLGTDHLDLWQLHSVRSVADVDRAFGAGGAMEFILDAKARGLARYVGVTGHADPEANLRAIAHWDRGMRFDAMQMPINPVDWHQRSFTQRVLPELVTRNIGVIAMKTSADGALVRGGLCTEAECLRYVWSLPVAVAVVGMEGPELVRENAQTARAFQPLAATELDALRARLAPKAQLQLEWYKGG